MSFHGSIPPAAPPTPPPADASARFSLAPHQRGGRGALRGGVPHANPHAARFQAASAPMAFFAAAGAAVWRAADAVADRVVDAVTPKRETSAAESASLLGAVDPEAVGAACDAFLARLDTGAEVAAVSVEHEVDLRETLRDQLAALRVASRRTDASLALTNLQVAHRILSSAAAVSGTRQSIHIVYTLVCGLLPRVRSAPPPPSSCPQLQDAQFDASISSDSIEKYAKDLFKQAISPLVIDQPEALQKAIEEFTVGLAVRLSTAARTGIPRILHEAYACTTQADLGRLMALSAPHSHPHHGAGSAVMCSAPSDYSPTPPPTPATPYDASMGGGVDGSDPFTLGFAVTPPVRRPATTAAASTTAAAASATPSAETPPRSQMVWDITESLRLAFGLLAADGPFPDYDSGDSRTVIGRISDATRDLISKGTVAGSAGEAIPIPYYFSGAMLAALEAAYPLVARAVAPSSSSSSSSSSSHEAAVMADFRRALAGLCRSQKLRLEVQGNCVIIFNAEKSRKWGVYNAAHGAVASLSELVALAFRPPVEVPVDADAVGSGGAALDPQATAVLTEVASAVTVLSRMARLDATTRLGSGARSSMLFGNTVEGAMGDLCDATQVLFNFWQQTTVVNLRTFGHLLEGGEGVDTTLDQFHEVTELFCVVRNCLTQLSHRTTAGQMLADARVAFAFDPAKCVKNGAIFALGKTLGAAGAPLGLAGLTRPVGDAVAGHGMAGLSMMGASSARRARAAHDELRLRVADPSALLMTAPPRGGRGGAASSSSGMIGGGSHPAIDAPPPAPVTGAGHQVEELEPFA